jgi:hypothetical protein
MPETTPTNPAPPVPRERSRRRRNVFGASPNRDEYVRLIENGWSSLAVERYASHRHGEDIPSSTIRTWCLKHEVKKPPKPTFTGVDPERVVDVMGLRAQLIQLQAARIQNDVRLEIGDGAGSPGMGKLFNTTRGEIALLNQLLNDHRLDQEAADIVARVTGQPVQAVPTQEEAGPLPHHATLGQALGAVGVTDLALARKVHELLPRTAG